MNQDDAALLQNLFVNRQVLSLGVLVDGEPYVSMVPFAVRQDMSGFIIHASRLARHSKGLFQNAPFSILIHVPEMQGQDPLQMPRVTLQGGVHVLSPGSAEYVSCKQAYLNKFPQSEQTFALGDFTLYFLEVKSGRLVAGFARTLNLNAHHLRELK